jgi:hypothetical protein
VVIRSTTHAGGTSGAIGGCGMSNGGIGGGAEAVGLMYLATGICVSSSLKALTLGKQRCGHDPAMAADRCPFVGLL